MTDFVSLHNHTHFSILNSLVSPKELFVRAKELGQNAVAVTDYGTLSGAWDSLKVSKETGVKLIIGCELYFVNNTSQKDDKLRYIVLIAKNHQGYRNLLSINKYGFENSAIVMKKVLPIIDWPALEKYAEGLICLTGCGNGIVGQLINDKNFDEAESTLKRLSKIFGSNLGVEVQTHNLARGATYYSGSVNQVFTNAQLIRLAKKLDLRLVPTSNSHYLKKDESDVHDVLLAIAAMQPVYSNARIKYNVSDLYLKSGDEVKTFFSRNHGEDFAKELCANSIYFSELCEKPDWIDPKFSNPTGKELPVFPVEREDDYSLFKDWMSIHEDSQRIDQDKAYLRFRCEQEFKTKVAQDRVAEYKARLDEELDVIEYHGFSSYMLIVADYITWARRNGIRVGLGRGSVGGSLIAFLLGIHGADPIKYKLIFARFHNKEKSSFPDIDTDFSPAGRDKVQEYIRQKYGSEHVAHVSNINTITPKVFARDVARACEFGGSRQAAVDIGNSLADSIPKKIDEKEVKTFEAAIEKAPLCGEYASKSYPELKKYAAICGKNRAWATHAAGLVISQRPLPGFVPLRKDKDGAIAIEFDKEQAEELGLVKMDTLGLETLDIIDETYRLVKEAGKPLPPDPPNFEEYDKETYDLISKGDTFCVFQLGTSAGTIDLCRKIRPKSIEDISHINSLARPSARDIREGFIAAKEGRTKVKLLHPSLKRAFGDTFGFGLYEESLMYLAQDVAGWSLHEADRLRKLTKEKGKNPKKVLQWRSDFISDAKKNNDISENIAMKIWDEVVDKFQGYGFNMSHSIMYSMISYYTAYLKAHYPVEFLLANLMSELRSNAKVSKDNIDKIKQELRNRGIKINSPDINQSDIDYKVLSDGSLLTGLQALAFVGDDAMKDLVSKRPFKSFDDFMLRVDSQKVKTNHVQALAASGFLDNFGISRKVMYLYCSDYKKKLQVWLKKHNPEFDKFEYPWPVDKEWSPSELYALEKSYLDETFICGKKEAYMNFFRQRSFLVKDILLMKDRDPIPSVRAEIKSVFEFKVKKETSRYLGENMIKATIEDEGGDQITLTVFPNKWKDVKARMRDLYGNKYKFEPGLAVHFSGTLNVYEDEIGIILESFYEAAPPPPMPKDMKHKKISLKKSNNDSIKNIDLNSTDKVIENIEDELFDEGLIDLDQEDD